MPYIFPKRTLKKQDVLDPVEMNEDFLPAAEVYAGKLNAHNISKHAALTIERDGTSKTAYYNYHYVKDSIATGIGSPGGYRMPGPTAPADATRIPNDFEWSTVDSVTATTGLSTLWIVGHLQYVWLGFSALGQHSYSYGGYVDGNPTGVTTRSMFAASAVNSGDVGGGVRPCRVQFAIRIDGSIVRSTVTGSFDPFEVSSWAIKPTTTRTASSRKPGFAEDWQEQPTGIGPEVFPVRLGCSERVQPGTHTIELVARRIPPRDKEGFDTDDEVYIYNRRLFALDCPTYPPTDTTAASLDVKAFDTEQVISANSLGADRINKIETALNNIEEGAPGRGALAHYHLPSAVIAKNQNTITGGKATLTAEYPGFGVDTFASAKNGTGWWLLQDASSNELKTTNSSAFSSSENSIFIIMANVQVESVGASNSQNDRVGNFGALTLGYNTASGSTALQLSECVFNHFTGSSRYATSYNTTSSAVNVANSKPFNEDVDIPLFAIVKSSTLSEDINYFAVYGATTSDVMDPGSQNALVTKRGNILVIQLKV